MMDVMIDIETYGHYSNAVIVQIGSVIFDRYTGNILDEFKINVNPESCISYGLEMDVSTVEWWMNQSEDARKSIQEMPRKDIKNALEAYCSFIRNNAKHEMPNVSDEDRARNIITWSHASFDIPILNNAFKAVGCPAPWHYRSCRDLRTLIDLTNYDIYKNEKRGTHHDALDDCKFQVEYVVGALKSVEKNEGN